MGNMEAMQQLHVDYLALRAQVRDGDTIAVHATGAYGAALGLGLMGPHGHVGIARSITIDGTTRMMVIEENPGGGRYRPLSHYQGVDFDVYSAPEGVDGRAASSAAVLLLDGLAKYDWHDIERLAAWGIVRAFARLFDDKLPEPKQDENTTEGGMICSALVTAAYVKAGWQPAGPCAWPSALTQQLGTARLLYRPTF